MARKHPKTHLHKDAILITNDDGTLKYTLVNDVFRDWLDGIISVSEIMNEHNLLLKEVENLLREGCMQSIKRSRRKKQ